MRKIGGLICSSRRAKLQPQDAAAQNFAVAAVLIIRVADVLGRPRVDAAACFARRIVKMKRFLNALKDFEGKRKDMGRFETRGGKRKRAKYRKARRNEKTTAPTSRRFNAKNIPDWIRTSDLRFRKPSLYPTELRGRDNAQRYRYRRRKKLSCAVGNLNRN